MFMTKVVMMFLRSKKLLWQIFNEFMQWHFELRPQHSI
jgi:hypothetical protein